MLFLRIGALCDSRPQRCERAREKGTGSLATTAAAVDIDATAALSRFFFLLAHNLFSFSIHFPPSQAAKEVLLHLHKTSKRKQQWLPRRRL